MSLEHSPTRVGVDRIMRMHEVCDSVGLSRSTIYDKIAKGEFPSGIKLGQRAIGWRASWIDGWLLEQEKVA